MKFSVLSLFAFAATVVVAIPQGVPETNAERMRRGLPPNSPLRRAPTPVVEVEARTWPKPPPHPQPSGGPSKCPKGKSSFCCAKLTHDLGSFCDLSYPKKCTKIDLCCEKGLLGLAWDCKKA